MEILFERKSGVSPKLSIILLDWSCRESFHILRYLQDQTIPPDQYEVIWIEYYNRRASEIADEIKRSEESGRIPVIGKWIVLDISDEKYYHKHLMYNVGIVASKGEIVVICDSDAIAGPRFVENIIKTFQEIPNIVLHLDEVRNTDRRFYPFNYPTIPEIIGGGCINWSNGKTTGIIDTKDRLHTRNYGACMCANRQDIINIGGADEHIDYLGHICGPYDMTFRLINAGKKEIWHEEEYLYHTWHPGTDGFGNYLGPHDGMNMSTTALDTMKTGRILPLVENPAIRQLRQGNDTIIYDDLLLQCIPEIELVNWRPQKTKRDLRQKYVRFKDFCRRIKRNPSRFFRDCITWLNLYRIIILLIIRQIYHKGTKRIINKNLIMRKSPLRKLALAWVFFVRMFKNNMYTVQLCRQTLVRLNSRGVHEIAIYKIGFVAKILSIVAKQRPMKIHGIFDNDRVKKNFMKHKILATNSIKDYQGKIVIASLLQIQEKSVELMNMGVPEDNIIGLQ